MRASELTAMFDYADSVDPKHWWSRLARKRGDRWIEDIVAQIRAGRLRPAHDTAAHVVSLHHDFDGALLSPHVAAVELINVVRPTVATAVYLTFVAHALHQYPECRRKLESGDSRYAAFFVQEVRRFYPFFPSVAARVQRDFQWNGYRLPRVGGSFSTSTAPTTTRGPGTRRMSSGRSALANGTAARSTSFHRAAATTTRITVVRANGSWLH